jgi:hypothetical protein
VDYDEIVKLLEAVRNDGLYTTYDQQDSTHSCLGCSGSHYRVEGIRHGLGCTFGRIGEAVQTLVPLTSESLRERGMPNAELIQQAALAVRSIIVSEGATPRDTCLRAFKALHVGAGAAEIDDTTGVAGVLRHAADFGFALAAWMLEHDTLDFHKACDKHLRGWRTRKWSE